MILQTVCVGPYQVNCYLLASEKGREAIIIDPGDDEHKIRQVLRAYDLTPAFIVNTHGHIDHIGCDAAFQVPVYVSEGDLSLLKSAQLNLADFLSRPYQAPAQIKTLKDGELIGVDSVQLEVISMPGHTRGGIALRLKKPDEKKVFTGDSLFRMAIGRTDFPGSDEAALKESIQSRLFTLPDETVIYPGHGPSSTIGYEKKNNQFFA
jgi:hydroxyacylglutathione hydrolase